MSKRARPHNRKKRPNPARFLTDKQLGEVAGDCAIQTMFGLLGTALAASSPSLRKTLLKVATKGGIEIAPGIIVASTEEERDQG